ncbi:hypothetical protein PIB30_014818 [Stylosanthes scabra]|uniref:Uncharacterized protein n=1 Tax=Stylosanthes scabra TaxID=79078 RepID=A0ABU6Q7T7_9FABA|nr:hypothetical protein [Stylosanthes scabra]
MDSGACSQARAKRKSIIQEKKLNAKTSLVGNGLPTSTRRPLQEVTDGSCVSAEKGKQARRETCGELEKSIEASEICHNNSGKTPTKAGENSILPNITPISVLDIDSIPSPRNSNEVSETNTPEPNTNHGSAENTSAKDSRRARRKRAAIIRRTAPQRRKRASPANTKGNINDNSILPSDTPITVLDFDQIPSDENTAELSQYNKAESSHKNVRAGS